MLFFSPEVSSFSTYYNLRETLGPDSVERVAVSFAAPVLEA